MQTVVNMAFRQDIIESKYVQMAYEIEDYCN